MQSLTDKLNELRQHLKRGVGAMKHTGFDPVYYLVFSPSEMLQAKLFLPEMLAQLRLDGFEPRVLSMTAVLNGWFRSHKLRPEWQNGLRSADDVPRQFQSTFSRKLEKDRVVAEAIQRELDELQDNKAGLLLLTDLEALHPLLHISGIEQQLTGKFHVPTVVLYPGIRGGAYSLRFLGIHRENGNYRSIHIG